MRRHGMETLPITGPLGGEFAFGRWISFVTGHFDETLLLFCYYHGQTVEKNSPAADDLMVPIWDAMTHHDVTWGLDKVPWAVVGLTPLFQETHQCVKDKVQGGPESPSSGCALEVGRGPRHIVDVVPGHCSLQAGLWLCRVWHSIKHQPATTGQHPQHWIKTGAWSILHQPSLQFFYAETKKLPWRSAGWSCPWITISKHVPALKFRHIMPCMNSTKPPEICMPQAKWARRYSRPPTRPVGLRVEAAVASAEINVDLICPLRQPSFPPGTHKYD